jgi:hypothetical protein
VLVGALPLAFGVRQFVEGFVWLGVRGARRPAWLMRRRSCTCSYRSLCRRRSGGRGVASVVEGRHLLWPSVVAGVVLAAHLARMLVPSPITATARGSTIA